MSFDLESLSLIQWAQEYPEVWKLFSLLDAVDDTSLKASDIQSAQGLRSDNIVEYTDIWVIRDNFPTQETDGSLVL